jgi:hypothetical protein
MYSKLLKMCLTYENQLSPFPFNSSVASLKGGFKTINRRSISEGERMHSSSRPRPAGDATKCELRGKQDTPSKRLNRESYDAMDGRKGKNVGKEDEEKSEYHRG